MLIFAGLLFFKVKGSGPSSVPTPTLRPTATPFPPAPTIPESTPKPVPTISTPSATIIPEDIGRLSFIKDGDIYHSDLGTFTLLVKNSTPAGDKLSWSPMGNLLSWRPKSEDGIPALLVLYNRLTKNFLSLLPSKEKLSEIVDYVWFPDEKRIAALTKATSYDLSLFTLDSDSGSSVSSMLKDSVQINQIGITDTAVIYTDSEGIKSIDMVSNQTKLLVSEKNIVKMKASPDGKKIYYSKTENGQNSIFIINADGSSRQKVEAQKTDMGTTGLPARITENGLIPYLVWYPKGDKALIGFNYLKNLPLVGVYNLKDKSFLAIAPFTLYDTDFMVDDLRLVGARIDLNTENPAWNVSVFTMEDGANLNIIRVIPQASSPSFYGKGLE